jgi:hypothetical protein
MSKETSVPFSLTQIKTLQFLSDNRFYTTEAEVVFGCGIGFAIEKRKKAISCRFLIEFKNEHKESPFLLLEVECIFKISPKYFNSLKNDAGYLIPKGFGQHLGIITTGTARGILHEKTISTNFNGFLLRTVNLVELIKENVEITD